MALLTDMLAQEFTAEEISIGVRCHLDDSPFFPAFSDIAKQLRDPNGEAWDTWREILEHIARAGYTNPPKLEAAAQNALDCVGGYLHLCEMESAQINVAAAQYCRAYSSMQKRRLIQKQMFGNGTLRISKPGLRLIGDIE